MSAVRTRILFGDDTDLLARARVEIISRPELDVVMAGTTQEAVEVAISSPRPRVAILPATGELDGMDVCRKLKTASPEVAVILALSIADAAQRDACFVAGADDVVFAPVEASVLTARIEARTGPAFRSAPRAVVELIVHLQGSATGPVVECYGQQISREALLINLPSGLAAPPVGTLVRAIFTLYEGGTVSAWARFAPGEGDKAAVRFVGLTDQELRSLDYFVDFYRKSATARAAVEEVTNDQIRAANAEVTTTTSTATPAKTNTGGVIEDLKPSDESLHALVDADLDGVAAAAARASAGREGASVLPPPGFSVLRFKTLIPKLTASEISALRGTTMYNDILADLRLCSGAKLRLFEMNAQLRAAKGGVTPMVAERAALAAIAEAQMIHKRLEGALEARVKAGNTDAVRDLGAVNAGLVSACVDLKRTLDIEILKKQGSERPAAVSAAAATGPAKYDKPSRDEAAPPGRPVEKAKSPGGSGSRRAVLGVLLVAGMAAAVWQNRFLFLTRPPQEYVAPAYDSAIGPIHIITITSRGDELAYLVDATWQHATQAERDAVVALAVAKAAQENDKSIGIYKATGEKILGQTVAASTAPAPASPAPTMTPS